MGSRLDAADAETVSGGARGSSSFASIDADAAFLEPSGEAAIEWTADKGLAPTSASAPCSTSPGS
jgi:hypothetical protein